MKQVITVLLLAVVLVGCATSPDISAPGPDATGDTTAIEILPLPDAAGAGLTGEEPAAYIDPLKAAQDYLRQATLAIPPQLQDLQLRAGAALMAAGKVAQAEQLLERIDVTDLSNAYLVRKRLLRARVALERQRPRQTLTLLAPFSNLQGLAPNYRTELLWLRARAQLARNDSVEAVRNLMARENYLVSDRDLLRNQQLIWRTLGSMDGLALQIARERSSDPEFNAWLDLALLDLEFGSDRYRFNQAASEWRRINAGHSGNRLLEEWLLQVMPATGEITNIALLLPLTSKFSHAAQAVHDGFMAMNRSDGDPKKPHVMVYDTGAEPSLAAIYYRLAWNEGADLIVGPLGKEAVAAVSEAEIMAVPTLLLGSAPVATLARTGMFQFDLAPEQEAMQVAERAYLDGHRVAGVLYPENDWGQRMLAAFDQRWQQLGGIIAEAQPYLPTGNDFSLPIKQLLNLNNSEGRKSTLSAMLGAKLEFQGRRRQDVDFLFLAAQSGAARLLKPQINFFQGDDLPVSATSHVYTGRSDAVNDADLNGIRFGDMPWILRSDERMILLRKAVGRQIEPGGPLDRLYALGVDAYAMAKSLRFLNTRQGAMLVGVTAMLRVDQHNRVRRQLTWARFQDGVPVVDELLQDYQGYMISNVQTDWPRPNDFPSEDGPQGGTTGTPISN